MKKRIISGLTAMGMVLLQVPVLITTTLADSLSMELAYWQVLDDIVKEYGVFTDEYEDFDDLSYLRYRTGLTNATLIDFDNNGSDELLLYYPESEEPENVGFKLELWEYENGVAVKRMEKKFTHATGMWLFDEFTSIQRSPEGWYFFYSNSSFPGGGIAEAYETLDEYVYFPTQYGMGEFESWETHVQEDFNSNKDKVGKFENSTAIDFITGGELYWEPDFTLYYDLRSQYIAHQANSYESLEADEILAKLPYTGDISKIRLTAEQALAMAEYIEEERDYEYLLGTGRSIALFDGGNGTPVLWMIDNFDESLYSHYTEEFTGHINHHYYGAGAEQLAWDGTNLVENKYVGSDSSVYVGNSGSELINFLSFFDCSHFESHKYENGIVGDVETSFFSVTCPPSSTTEERENIEGFSQEMYGTSGILNFDWSKVEYSEENYGSGTLYFLNGNTVDSTTFNSSAPDFSPDKTLGINFGGEGMHSNGNWADGKEVAALLHAYAEKAQVRYNFPELSQETATIEPILSQLDLSGEVVEFYQLGENIFYLIFLENGVETGCIVKLVKIDGELCYTMVEKSSSLLDEDFLLSEGTNYSINSNILLNFEEVYDFSEENQYLDYLNLALDNITGASLTDNGKSELVTFLQDSITNFATYVLDSSGGTGEINSSFVADLLTKSNDLCSSFLGVLADKSEELNKNLQQCIRVIVRGLEPENWTIFLNEDLLDQLGENNLQVFLEDGQHGLEFSGEDLNLLLTTYGGVFVNVQMSGDEQYFITFADKEGNNIEKLEAPVKIFLPTDNEFATVMLEYAQGTENWGGQFNSSTNTIQFSTIHSGTYLIVDNSVEIHDVDEAYKSIIQFMVSKGFFTLDEEGNFNPNGTMSRYDFTKIIVSMFFALDRGLTSNFLDVSADSPYYSYIASGESRDIVAGYDDGLFYGDTIITEEMVFTLIAQTLVDKKGYSYPNELDSYLKMVTGGQNSTEWAQPGVALSVRDAIVLPNESINPTGDISRQNAAVYLYRLFMLLEEKQQVNFQLAEEINVETVENTADEAESTNIMPMVVGATFLVGGSLWYFNDKKKKTNNSE